MKDREEKDKKKNIMKDKISITWHTRVYPKVSGLSRERNIHLSLVLLIGKQQKGLWRKTH
jgi:hypothetical protein